MDYEGVSPLADSCIRLVHQKARRTFNRISPENKRWIDLEDVVQDGFIEAWEASQRYESAQDYRARYSTYLYRGLDMLFSAKYAIPLRQQKRVTRLTELDAPIPGSDNTPDVPAHDVSPERMFQAISGVIRVCYAIPPAALTFLLGVIMTETGRIRRRNADDISCIPGACRDYGVTRQDMDLVMASFEGKGLVLEGVVRATVKLGEDDAKVLECVECVGKFSLADARAGRYSATSLTCSGCLKKLADSDEKNTCFGRRKMVQHNRTVTEGYSEADSECRLHCRDRAACVRYIEDKEKRMSKNVSNLDVDLEDVDFSDVEAEDTEATTDETEEDEAAAESDEKPVKATKKTAAKKAAPAKETKKAPAKETKKAPAKETKVTKNKAVKDAPKATKAPAKVAATKKAAPVKEAKPAKVAKEKGRKGRTQKSAEKVDPKVALKEGLIKLDDQGRDLPFKPGSMMRYCLEAALEPGGATEKKLEAEVIKLGYDFKFQRSVLLSGKSGDSSLRPYPSTHVWKAEAKDGRIYVSDVKRIAYYARLARIDGK